MEESDANEEGNRNRLDDIVIEDINIKAIDIWMTISNLLPSNIFKRQIIEAEGALMFFVQKI